MRTFHSRHVVLWIAIAIGGRLPVALGAQARRVVVTVVDQSGAPLPSADVQLRRIGARDVQAATTTERGTATFEISNDSTDLVVTARKIGYSPNTVQAPDKPLNGERITNIQIALARSTVVLDTVRTSADIPRSKDYFLNAAEIARSSRYIGDALDAVTKLHPSMMGDGYRLCPAVRTLFINGKAAPIIPPQTMSRATAGSRVSAAGVRAPRASEANPRDARFSDGPPNVATVLASIHAEHLAEIRYVNCWDTTMPGVNGRDALYVVLKPGVSWDLKNGSRIVDSAAFTRP